MAQVVIAGGGVVGQATALLLGRHGHDVLVVEHDGPPPSRSPDDDVDAWHRPGVPHAIHAHVFRARAVRVLRDSAPDVLGALDARGVACADVDFGAGFEDDVALSARRPVVEAVLHRAAAAEERVTHRYGAHVDGLLVRDRDGRHSVEAVVVGDDHVHADLVIDACGRRSRTVRWLRDAGVAVTDERFPCDLHYVARHYRLRDGAAIPSRRVPVGVRTPYGLFVAFDGDNGTFSLAGAVSKVDPHRAALRRGDTFDRVLAAIPDLAPWVEAGTPITPVRLMAGLANRRRSLAPGGAPPEVDGLALIGDASLYTNATLGQGIALGLWQAQQLLRLLEEDGATPRRVAAPLERWTDATLGPWFMTQVAVDAGLVDVLRAGARGLPPPGGSRPTGPMDAINALAAAGDPDAAAARARVSNLLTSPEEVLDDSIVRERVHRWLADHPVAPTPPDPLPRARFEALVG